MSYVTKAKVFAKLDEWLAVGEPKDKNHAVTWLVAEFYNSPNPWRIKHMTECFNEWAAPYKIPEDEVEAEVEIEPVVNGVIEAPEDFRERAVGDTFVFTSAQANTFLNKPFWNNLLKLVDEYNADLHVSRFTYNKATHGKNSVKPDTLQGSDAEDLWYDPEIEPYVSDQQLQITDDLVWFGELNIIPTRVDPINGFENHGRGASIIVPHTKMAMKSIPTMKSQDARFAFSTGTVTARNYIEKAAGQKATLHHVYGAMLVEVDEKGTWWARQLNADNDGTIYDLNNKFEISGGKSVVSSGHRPEVMTHGDLHGNKLDLDVASAVSDIIDELYPRNQVFHDTIDFQPRNHHNIKDAHFLHDMFVRDTDSVEFEFKYIADLMDKWFARPNTKHWVVTSNHDQALEGWLRNTDGFYDPPNSQFWLQTNLYCAKYRAARKKPRPFWHVLSKYLPTRYHWGIIHEDDSLQIAGIEHGLHGHLGPNGARGSPKNLRTAGKANTAHTHSAGIVEGVYTAGVFGSLDMGYNKGLSGWSHSFILTYPNGKRSIFTIKDGKAWRG